MFRFWHVLTDFLTVLINPYAWLYKIILIVTPNSFSMKRMLKESFDECIISYICKKKYEGHREEQGFETTRAAVTVRIQI